MEHQAETTRKAAPIDFELRVSLPDDGVLHHTLHSPSGVAGYSFKEIPGMPFKASPEAFRADRLAAFEVGKPRKGRHCRPRPRSENGSPASPKTTRISKTSARQQQASRS